MRHSKALGLLLLLLLLSLVGTLSWLTYRQVRQDRLNHALIAAIQREDVSAGLAALNAGADPNSQQDTNKPLSFWQSLRHLFSGLWKHDKTPPTRPGNTALMLALKTDRIVRTPFLLSPLIQALVARGANVNVRDSQGDTPLMLATGLEPINTVRALLDKGADANARDIIGHSALLWAVTSDSSDVVKLLLARGANVNTRDEDEYTALRVAFQSGYEAIARLLISHGAEVNLPIPGTEGRMLLMEAAGWGTEEDIGLLLQAGAHIEAHNANGETALGYAVNNCRPENVRALVKWHANVHAKSFDKKTLLAQAKKGLTQRMATSFNHGDEEGCWREIVHLLKQVGAKE